MKLKNFNAGPAVLIAISLFGSVLDAPACGPDFPNNLLSGGDAAVLQAPVADFKSELLRMKLVATDAHAVPLAGGQKYYEQSADADVADLSAALEHDHFSIAAARAIIGFHLAQRASLNAYLDQLHVWEHSGEWIYDGQGMHQATPSNAPPVFPGIQIAPGLPREFTLYFKGYCAWLQGEEWPAAKYWEDVLALPPESRHFKSTWAAFMLGKYHAARTNAYDEAEAIKCFEQVRELAKDGFADSLGLVTAGIGLEAQIYLRQQDYPRAIRLYLEQFAAGDDSAVESLRFAAARAIAGNKAAPKGLDALAKDAPTRRVITAYFISRHHYDDWSNLADQDAAKKLYDPNAVWLDAVEKAGVRDVDSAEQLALAAYQANDMTTAQRWIKLAADRPVARWLQAKLDMRAGRMGAAAKLLARLSRKFPPVGRDTNCAYLMDNISVPANDYYETRVPTGQQVLGELGVLRLARREYTESLDALLRSDYWEDAAYVAERVLTIDELKTYVDRHWPPVSAAQLARENGDSPADWDYRTSINPRTNIRCLLARRLARENNYAAARKYYPANLQTNLDIFTAGLRDGADAKLSNLQRGRALFVAACMARTNGLELFGTELEPDWGIYGGNYAFDAIWQGRATNARTETINISSPDELARAALPQARPDERFHYRWQAADLAWAAAKFMPDNSPETAEMLCRGGAWIKNSDPDKADQFYKSLIRRCRQTAIGAEADTIRWFPLLDENGNVLSQRLLLIKLTPAVTNAVSRNGNGEVFSTEFPVPGRYYTVHRDDTLTGIATAAMRMDMAVTPEKVALANPGLKSDSLKIGQLVMIPFSADPAKPVEAGADDNLPLPGGAYVIQAGDTLAKIVGRLQKTNPALTLEKLKAANPGLDGSHIHVGQMLVLPAR